MNKILLALVITVFSVGAMACDGSGKGKEKETEEKRMDSPVSFVRTN